jgi:F0F1-type ATP synthase epsilon subunit
LITVRKNNEENIFFVEEGTVEFENNNLLVLSSTAINLEKLDKKFIEKTIKDSQEKFNNNVITDKEKYILSHKIETLKEIN